MYLEDERVEKCQAEIRRLRSVCRENEDDIKRLNVLLYNAIEYLNGLTGQTGLEWYEETLGITPEELKNAGIDWLADEPEEDDRSEKPWDYGEHFE